MKNGSRNIHPPRLAEWLIKTISWEEDRDDITDNLKEDFNYRCSTLGKLRALYWYWVHTMRSILPCIGFESKWRLIMFLNYLKSAFRHFRKYKSFTIINILGLAIGIAVCMLIFLWVQDELNFERFNKNLDDIYAVVKYDPTEDVRDYSSIPAPVIPFLRGKYAEIKYASRYRNSGRRLFSFEGNNQYENAGGFADPELFDIFTLDPIHNDPKTALQDINTIVFTRSMAERYFGSNEPIGQTIKIENNSFIVGAVIEDIPQNSSIRFDYLLPFENYQQFERIEKNNWGWYSGYRGFLILQENVNPAAFEKSIESELTNNEPNTKVNLALYPYKKFRLHGLNNNGTMKSVLIFSAIGILILLIACINFINLTTAQAGIRAKEIGLRKVIGANKALIRRQIYSELFLTVFVAFALAIILSLLFLPRLNALSDKSLSLTLTGNAGMLLGMLGIALFTAGISGTYPALYLSSFSPVNVMKSSGATGSSKSLLRKILVVAQFTISIILIVSATTITKQMRFIENQNLGYEKDNLIYISLLGDMKERLRTVKSELERHPGIQGITVASTLPNDANSNAGGLDWEGRPADVRGAMNFISVEKDYFQTVGIEFIEGGTFTTEPNSRLLREFIVNEKALEILQIDNPVGKWFKMWDRDPGRITGIVKNVHNASLHREIRPVFYVQFPYFYLFLIINIQSENVQHTIASIKDTMQRINPDYPFEFHFLDERLDLYYQSEMQTNRLITSFTLQAVLISCLGLFGLSLFMAEQRTKEVGIRKTLGASVTNIVGLMSRNFLVLVIISNLIAWPTAYFIMSKWLQNFAYRTNLGVDVFILSGSAAIIIALLTVSFQSVKAAIANPVDSLRYE